jgi:hypothetical protein
MVRSRISNYDANVQVCVITRLPGQSLMKQFKQARMSGHIASA